MTLDLLLHVQQFKRIFDNFYNPVLLLSTDELNILSGNSKALKFFDILEEDENKTWFFSLTKDNITENKINIINFNLKEKQSFYSQFEFLTSSKESFWANLFINKTNFFNEDFYVAIIEDITDKKLLEENFEKREKLLLESQEIGKVGNWEFDLKTGKVNWTKEVFKIYDLDYEENFDVNKYYQIIDPIDREKLFKSVDNCISKGIPYEFEVKHTKKDGSSLYTYCTGKPEFDKNGKIIKLLGTTLDITDKRKLEEKSIECQNFLQEVENLINFGTYEFDIETNTWNGSDNFYRLIGVSSDYENTLESLIKLVSEEFKLTVNEALNKAINSGEKILLEFKLNNKLRNKDLWVNLKGIITSKNSKVNKIVGTLQDITEYKEIENLKNTLYSIKNNEIRIPIKGIINSTNLLLKTELNEEQEEHLSNIKNYSRAIIKTLDHI